MSQPSALVRTRVARVRDRLLAPAIVAATTDVDVAAHHVAGEPIRYDEAMERAFTPFPIGAAWGPPWDTTWFRIRGTAPLEWAPHTTSLTIRLGYDGWTGFGAEGLLWWRGEPMHGVSPNHDLIPLTGRVAPGEPFEFYLEAAANPKVDVTADPAPLYTPDPDGPALFRLDACHLAAVDEQLQALVDEWSLLLDIVDQLDPDTPRAAQLLHTLNSAATLVDPDDVRGSAAAARAALEPALATPAAGSVPTLLAVGNSHIDTAWLWPFRETVRKCSRTFSTVLALIERNPDFRFAASQPQQFDWMKQHYPLLFERIKKSVADGVFEPVGAMWVEPDTNMPSGESLVRQIVFGQRFLLEEFGCSSDIMWLPDSFGYTAALPQIMRLAGMHWFVSQKMSWNQVNRFPHHTFVWEGLDGSRVLAHFLPADTYNGSMSVQLLRRAELNFAQKAITGRAIYAYGFGDGGGGPTEEMVRRARLLRNLDGAPRVRLSGAAEALAELESAVDVDELPVWSGELYLENHRGTFTTHADIKRSNRKLEITLRDAELFGAMADQLVGREYPRAELDTTWKTLLLHQFHDVLPGASINRVHGEANRSLNIATDHARRILAGALEDLAAHAARPNMASGAVFAANPLTHDRLEVTEVGDGLAVVRAPALGWEVQQPDEHLDQTWPALRSGENWMSNGFIHVEWDASGLLTQILHLETGRDVLPQGRQGNLLQLHQDRPNANDAWDIDVAAYESVTDLTRVTKISAVEQSVLRVSVRVVREFGSSRLTQEMRLDRGSRRLEFHTVVDWHETHKLLKVAFPVDVLAPQASFEIQFGHIQRPTHRNTSWDEARFEVPAHTWADISESGFGVALLNDCKYGYDVHGNVLRLTLLRSPTFPDPLADRGRHEFAYALLPHDGDVVTGRVASEAHAFNSPLHVVPAGTGSATLPAQHSFVTVDDPAAVVTAVKQADDGNGVVVRLYESTGGRRTARVSCAGLTPHRVDLLERALDVPLPLDGHAAVVSLRPFEVVTLHFREG